MRRLAGSDRYGVRCLPHGLQVGCDKGMVRAVRYRLWLLALAACMGAPLPAPAKDTGLIFVSNEKTNNLIVLDPKTYKVVKDLKVSRRPRDMHFSADHTKLFVACGDDDVIDIIDVAKLEVVGKLSTGSS